MDKKKIGGLAALVSAMLYGGAQLLDLEARLIDLEGLHPELGAPEAPEPEAEEPGKSVVPAPSPTDPAPGEEHLELDEDDEWVPAEEATEGEG